MSEPERRSSPGTGNACGVCGEPMLQCDYGVWFRFNEVYLCNALCRIELERALREYVPSD